MEKEEDASRKEKEAVFETARTAIMGNFTIVHCFFLFGQFRLNGFNPVKQLWGMPLGRFNPHGPRRRKIRVTRGPLPQIELPVGRWDTRPAVIQKWYEEMFPTEKWIPSSVQKKRASPVSDMLVDMIRGGHVVVYPTQTGGKPRLQIILTARGKNARVLNRFLQDPKPFSQLHPERQEAALFSLLRDLVYAMDYDPATHLVLSDRKPLSRRELVLQLQDDANLENLDQPIVLRHGIEMSNWPIGKKRYYQFMAKKAHLSQMAMRWLEKDSNWSTLIRMRYNMSLWDGL